MPSRFTISNFQHIAQFLASNPDDIVSLASTCRDACEACDSETVWSLVVFYFFDEILPGRDELVKGLVNKGEYNRVLKVTKRIRNEHVSEDDDNDNDDDQNTTSTAFPTPSSTRNAQANPPAGSTQAQQRRGRRRRNNNNNNNNPTARTTAAAAVLGGVVAAAMPDGQQKGIVIDPNMPHRNTLLKADAIDGSSAANTRKMISERLLPSILFSCSAYLEFQVRALQATPFISRFSINIICSTLDQARTSFEVFENSSRQFNSTGSIAAKRARLASSGLYNGVTLFDGSTDQMIADFKALFQDHASDFMKYERTTLPHVSQNELSVFHKLVEVLQYSKVSRSFLTRIFAEFEETTRFADVLYSDLKHPQEIFAFHSTRFMNWKVQTAFSIAHVILWNVTALTSFINWPAIIQILAWIPKFLLITVPSSIVGDRLIHSLVSLIYAQPLWNQVIGAVSQQMTIHDVATSSSINNTNTTATPVTSSRIIITQDILNSGYFPSRFQNVIFRDATEFAEKASNATFTAMITSSSSPIANVPNNLLITIGVSSLLCGFVGHFPRLQGVQQDLQFTYLKHKLLHDFFTSWANRQTDFWCFFFAQLLRNFSTSTWLGNVLLAVSKIVSHHSPLWLTAFVSGKGRYNPLSVLMLPEPVQLNVSPWFVLAFYITVIYTVKECVYNHYLYDRLFCTDEVKTTNAKNETHKVRVFGSRKKHLSPKWFHVASSVAMNASLCALRWHFYFNQPENIPSSKSVVFGGILDAGSWIHFGKVVGFEFLIRGLSSLVEYIFAK